MACRVQRTTGDNDRRKADDITNMDAMIRDAILTAAGVDTEFANEILKFVGYRPTNRFASLFRPERTEAEYVLS